MIASVSGQVAKVGLDHLVLQVGGVGLHVHTTPATAAAQRTGASCELATSLVVREESLTLYGFDSQDAKEVFETVQTVPGVGPRLALAMLAVHSPQALRAALHGGDTRTLTRVPGIGAKSAERLVLELRDKVGAPSPGAATSAGGVAGHEQVQQALVGLGWSVKQADEALDAVAAQAGQQASVSSLLRAALQHLAKS